MAADVASLFANPLQAGLADAAAAGNPPRIDALVKDGADVNALGQHGATALMVAVASGSASGVEALMRNGADPALRDEDGETAVHLAALREDPAVLDALLRRGASPDVRNGRLNRTPIYDAILARQPESFARLLQARAEVNVVDDAGNTPLHEAAVVEDASMMLALLNAGADPRARNKMGATFQGYLLVGPPESNFDGGSARRATRGARVAAKPQRCRPRARKTERPRLAQSPRQGATAALLHGSGRWRCGLVRRRKFALRMIAGCFACRSSSTRIADTTFPSRNAGSRTRLPMTLPCASAAV